MVSEWQALPQEILLLQVVISLVYFKLLTNHVNCVVNLVIIQAFITVVL